VANGAGSDRLEIGGAFQVSGTGAVLLGGTTIGSINQFSTGLTGVGSRPLTVTFNSSATRETV
jgi:hypothetical protein